ncbi:MAG: bifunctional YncE family protein/alkaline phosphatase family protein [Bacteroidales bacterium]|nr:bifunctional YncE family protein/alkaline phosphatase family protein [Bacteroidales bacterium]
MKKTSYISILTLFVLTLFILIISQCRVETKQNDDLSTRKVGQQPDGSILVPTNQLLRPAGFQILFPGRPVDLAQSPDGKWLAVLNKNSLDLIRVLDRTIMQTLPLKGGGSFNGIAFSADGKQIYASQSRDKIFIAQKDEHNILNWIEPIQFLQPKIGGHPVPCGFSVNASGDKLYVALNRSNTLAVVDLADGSISEIPVGVSPYEVILLSSQKAYVSNWGGRQPEPGDPTYTTSGSEIVIDPKTGIANNGSVSVIDLQSQQQIKHIEVGLHPGAMALSPDKAHLYVACANSDIISVIDTKSDAVIDRISVRMEKDLPFGSAPNALAISHDGKQLFVANGTDNALCVIELDDKNEIAGFIPTGWYPGAVILDKDATFLFVANTKGIGSRNMRADRPGYNTHHHMGSISIVPLPDKTALQKMTEVVKENNSFARMMNQLVREHKSARRVAVPQLPGQESHFKHVVYIIKENRTYDQVFGDLEQGNGDPSLVHFGREVTPNHHALAEEFVLMDNYYCSGVLSADGHQWTDEAYVTDYIEKFFGDFPRSYPYDGGDPMAYSSSGFIWDNVMQHGLSFRNYGEFVDAIIEPENATFTDIYEDFITGTNSIRIRAKSNLPQMEPYTCPTFIGFPEKVPDIYRAAEFIKELKEFEKNDNFPNFIIMLLPNDHTSGTKPGLPTPRSAVADNDLALGQVVEAISHSKFWEKTCIFVTEDDPQAGLDHVDGHRTVGLVISPFTKRGQVISTYYSQINMFRTMENILGIPPLNQFDLAAEPMSDCFTNKPDFSPFSALPNNIPLDELNPELISLSGDARYWAQKSMEQNLDELDRIDEDTFNRIIWHSVKGYDVPYPVIAVNDGTGYN